MDSTEAAIDADSDSDSDEGSETSETQQGVEKGEKAEETSKEENVLSSNPTEQNPEIQEEDEEKGEKAEEISKEGSGLSSNPTEQNPETQQENQALLRDVFLDFVSRKRFENANQEVQQHTAATRGFVPQDVFLFEMQINHGNRLLIPAEPAADFFPSIPVNRSIELQITDEENQQWNMSVIYYEDEYAYMVIKGWKEFSLRHGLGHIDRISFYRLVPRPSKTHYVIKYARRVIESPEKPIFRRENFLFQLELDARDVMGYGRLFIPAGEVANHFPAVSLRVFGPDNKLVKEKMVKFTDGRNKSWYMGITKYTDAAYIIIQGWDEFAKEHKLEAMDLIKFYQPVHPAHQKHFLVEIEKKGGRGGPGNPFQQGGGYLPLLRDAPLPSKSRMSYGNANQEEVQHHPAAVNEFDNDESDPMDILLFETPINCSNRLLIPLAKAADFFPHEDDMVLQITDVDNEEWNMRLINYREENSYMVVEGWSEFALHHNLIPDDVIGFYLPATRLSETHYTVTWEDHRERFPDPIDLWENYLLFQLELNAANVNGDSRLFIPASQVANHFPAIITDHEREIVRFTDEQIKDWYMDIVRHDIDRILEGWDEFVREYKLESGDVVKFYRPDHRSHDKHFFIKFEKNWGGGGGQPGGRKRADGEGTSPPCQVSRKGKEKVDD